MLKNVFSRWTRGIERNKSGKRRRKALVPAPMQVEQLESRQLMTCTASGQFGPSGRIHDLTISLNNESSQDCTINAAAGGTAQFHVTILGPKGFTFPVDHVPQIQIGGSTPFDVPGTPSPDPVTGRQKFEADIPVPIPANQTTPLLVKVFRNPGGPTADVTTITVTDDSTFPTTTITTTANNPTNLSPIPVTVTFSESVTGFQASEVAIGNGTIGNFQGSGTTYTFDVTPTSNGVVTVDVAGNVASDPAGNGNTAATQLSRSFDNTPPTPPTAPVLDAVDDSGRSSMDGVTNHQTGLTFTGTNEAGSTVVVRLTNGGTIITQPAMLSVSGTTYTATFAGPLAEGTYVVEALSSDKATPMPNTSTSSPSTLVIDVTNPAQLTALDLTTATDTKGAHIVGDDNLTRSTTPSFTFTGAEVNAAVTLIRDMFSNATSTPASGATATSVTATATTAGVHQFAAFQTDLAGNIGMTSPNLAVAVDTTAPVVASVQLTTSLASNLKVPITTSRSPTLSFNLTDQVFSGFTNIAQLELVEKLANNTQTTLVTTTTTITTNSAQSRNLTPSSALSAGQHVVFVRATDAAGNVTSVTSSSDLIFFVSQPGAATAAAPGTPVFSETYFLGSTVSTAALVGATTLVVDREIPRGFQITVGDNTAFVRSTRSVSGGFELTLSTFSTVSSPSTQSATLINAVKANDRVTWLRPWTMSFDRTTQTMWFTNEDGSRLGQFDPTTSSVKLYDVGLTGADGFPATDAIDTHGVFFDFDTHITPRVWFVYRNTERVQDASGTTVVGNKQGRVAYLDLATGELVNVKLADLIDPAALGSPKIDTSLVLQPHAAFVDTRGHLWISVEDSKTLIEFDFDQVFNGTLNPNINARQGRAIVHKVPATFANIEPHGLGTVVDDRTGEQYVYFTDAKNPGSGRVYLLKPGAEISGNADRWFEWNMTSVLDAESRTTGHALFLAIDDHETPGTPEDDTILVVDPGRGISTPSGAMRELNPQSLIRAIQSGNTIPTSSIVRSVIIPKIPGALANATNSSPQLPFADREGNAFFVDALGSVGRFSFDDPGLTLLSDPTDPLKNTSLSASILEGSTTAALFEVTMSPVNAPVTLLNLNATPIGAAGRDDRSQRDGVDQYEVAQPSQRSRSDGAFRGFLNAGNTIYGSLAQSDFLSTTVFAETARRQMSVIADPTPRLAGALVEGRMAFQVARNGSLIMTSRAHGQLLDQQTNLSRNRILAGGITDIAEILIDGDSSAVTEANGNVHVFGKNQVGGLVEYRFNRVTNAWSTNVLPPPATGVLAGEPTAFVYRDNAEQVHVGALINRNGGQLLLYPNNGDDPTDLTALAGGAPTIFASVAIVEETASKTVFVYGADQAGNIVEYRFSTDTATGIPGAVTAVTINVASRPVGQVVRDTQIFQSLSAVIAGGSRHIFGTDGHSRLVHLEFTDPVNAFGENVTELTKAAATGYFDSFQQAFAARVHPELSVLVDPTNGTLFVYGTNGQDLVEFTHTGTAWSAANLTNDIMKGVGDRIPANKVFGAPGAYITATGDRRVFQINADGEVIEYAFRNAGTNRHFNTQNINLARGNTFTSLQSIAANVAPTLNIPAVPVVVTTGSGTQLVAPDASVSDPDSMDFVTGKLIVRTINGATGDLLGIRPQTLSNGDIISVSGSIVSYNGVPVFDSFTGGTENAPFVIRFTNPTSRSAIEALLQSVEFSAPAGSVIGVRFVAFELTDNAGGTSSRVAQQVTVDDLNNPATNPLIHPLL